MTTKPPHPKYGVALGGAPITIEGVTFYAYRAGIGRTVRATPDGRLELRTSYPNHMWWAGVDGETILNHRGKTRRWSAANEAMRHAVRAMRSKDTVLGVDDKTLRHAANASSEPVTMVPELPTPADALAAWREKAPEIVEVWRDDPWVGIHAAATRVEKLTADLQRANDQLMGAVGSRRFEEALERALVASEELHDAQTDHLECCRLARRAARDAQRKATPS